MLMTREFAIGDNNRATIDLTVQPLGDAAPLDVTCIGEMSRDGKLWIAAPELTVRATGAGTTQRVAPVSGEKLRFVLARESGTGTAAACAVDLRVRLDRA